jgi:hypothetical protein
MVIVLLLYVSASFVHFKFAILMYLLTISVGDAMLLDLSTTTMHTHENARSYFSENNRRIAG